MGKGGPEGILIEGRSDKNFLASISKFLKSLRVIGGTAIEGGMGMYLEGIVGS